MEDLPGPKTCDGWLLAVSAAFPRTCEARFVIFDIVAAKVELLRIQQDHSDIACGLPNVDID